MSITDDDFLQLTPTPVPVLNLVEGQYEQSVTVRLLRSWEVRNFKQKGALMSFDMLFLDSKDTMVQASIYHRRIQLYKSKLKEGKVYNLSNFEVVPSYSHYKITDHKFIIRFTDSTEINEVPCDEIPTINTEKFRLHNWREIEVLADTNLKLIDIVGQLLHVQGSNLEDNSSTQKIVLLILLQKNISLQVTLWDNQASAFRRIFHQTARKSSVIVITCLNPKKFAGKLQLSSTGSTKFYVDYNLEAVKEFMGRMGIQNNVAEASVAEAKSISKNYERWTISQIFDFIADGNEQEADIRCQAEAITNVLLPTKFVWNRCHCIWTRRKEGLAIQSRNEDQIQQTLGDNHYLKLLFKFIKKDALPKQIATIHKQSIQQTPHDSNPFDGEKECNEAIKEASQWATSDQLQQLFVTMLIHCEVKSPWKLWNNCWRYLAKDYDKKQQKQFNFKDGRLSDEEVQHYTFIQIQKLLSKRSNYQGFITTRINNNTHSIAREDVPTDLKEEGSPTLKPLASEYIIPYSKLAAYATTINKDYLLKQRGDKSKKKDDVDRMMEIFG